MKKHQMNQKKKAFTLVELIIVITILAILATIAFVSFQNYTKDSRDGNRLATLTQIEKGLNLVQIKTGKYPLPDGKVLSGALSLSGSELVVYSSMGIIDENISTMIKMNTIPVDPIGNQKYVYAVNNKQDTYQIATLLENLEATRKLPLIEPTYANTNYTAKVIGNHEVNIKYNDTENTKVWLTIVPSMIFNPEGGNILNTGSTYHIINGGENLPYTTSDKIITTKETGDKIIQHIRKSEDAKIITIDITEIVNEKNEEVRKGKIEQMFGTGNTQESKELLSSIGAITGTSEVPNVTILTQTVENIITGGSASSYTAAKTLQSCPHLGEEIEDKGSMIVYSENSIDKFANYTCEDRKGEVICNDGVLTGDTGFAYKTGECVKGEINHCSASGSYLYNGHTYSIPALNHGNGATNMLSEDFSESNGTFQYTLTNIECNDGVLINASEHETPTLESCNENFHTEDNQTCISNTKTNQACIGLPNNAAWNSIPTITQTWNGTVWIPTTTGSHNKTASTTECRYTCNTDYIWDLGTSQCVLNTPYVDDVFSTYLYTGNGGTQTINNGIALDNNGGMVWVKRRDATSHQTMVDFVWGSSCLRFPNLSLSQCVPILNYNSTGFAITSSDNIINASGGEYVSWTFRKADKFFAQSVANINSDTTISFPELGTIGMVMVQGTYGNDSPFYIWHRGLGSGKLLQMNSASQEITSNAISVSGTNITLSSSAYDGGALVVYAWAHDVGVDGMIQCGNFITNSSGVATVGLGWEPQFILSKSISGTSNWWLHDSVRGMNSSSTKYLSANTPNVEGASAHPYGISNGFQVQAYNPSQTYIYCAIRKP